MINQPHQIEGRMPKPNEEDSFQVLASRPIRSWMDVLCVASLLGVAGPPPMPELSGYNVAGDVPEDEPIIIPLRVARGPQE